MRKKWVFTLSIVLLGVVMRATFTTIPVVIDNVAHSFGLPVSQLGILTTLPLLTFAIFSPTTSYMTRRFGIEKTFLGALLLVLLGSLLRVASASMLFIGTILVGIGIAYINVLLPATLVKFTPNKIGTYTSLYSTTMTLMTAIFQIIAVPVTKTFSWQMLVVFLSVIVLLVVITWILHMYVNVDSSAKKRTQQSENKANQVHPWRNKYAWAMLVMAGIQSAVFYTSIAWVPTVAQHTGLTATQAGWVIGVMSLIGIPASMWVPSFLERANYKQRVHFMTGATSLWLIAIIMMYNTQAGLIWWLIVTSFIGLGGTAVFVYMVTSYAIRTRNPLESSALSGMAQTGGYLIAAGAPWAYGVLFAQLDSWFLQTTVMAIAIVIFICLMWFVERDETIFE
ncbi:MFS transporter [Weissella fangxianensis]|uniref:MFS transporter n=1 Tax=Weissella fangxianensis TaxID=2953879 RepID=UPI0021575E25|nr:MFS transporter [Weissella fangxianensis]